MIRATLALVLLLAPSALYLFHHWPPEQRAALALLGLGVPGMALLVWGTAYLARRDEREAIVAHLEEVSHAQVVTANEIEAVRGADAAVPALTAATVVQVATSDIAQGAHWRGR